MVRAAKEFGVAFMVSDTGGEAIGIDFRMESFSNHQCSVLGVRHSPP